MIPFYEYQNELMQAGMGNGINFPPHLHNDLELIYVTQGCVETQIGENGYPVSAGEICLIFPNQVHAYRTAGPGTKHIILIYRAGFCPELQGLIERKIPADPVVKEIHEDVKTAVRRLMDAGQMPGMLISTYFQLIWARLMEKTPLKEREPDAGDGLSAGIIGYITAHFSEKIDLETLSKEFGVSRYKISRVFTGTIGVPFYQYLNAMRVDKAKGMLQSRRHDILTIAYECGFESQQTFNRVFREECGMTPREFRKSLSL